MPTCEASAFRVDEADREGTEYRFVPMATRQRALSGVGHITPASFIGWCRQRTQPPLLFGERLQRRALRLAVDLDVGNQVGPDPGRRIDRRKSGQPQTEVGSKPIANRNF